MKKHVVQLMDVDATPAVLPQPHLVMDTLLPLPERLRDLSNLLLRSWKTNKIRRVTPRTPLKPLKKSRRSKRIPKIRRKRKKTTRK